MSLISVTKDLHAAEPHVQFWVLILTSIPAVFDAVGYTSPSLYPSGALIWFFFKLFVCCFSVFFADSFLCPQLLNVVGAQGSVLGIFSSLHYLLLLLQPVLWLYIPFVCSQFSNFSSG